MPITAMMMYAVPLVLGAFKSASMPGGGGTGSGLVSRKDSKDEDIVVFRSRFFFVMGERGGVVVGNDRRMYMRCRRRSGLGGGRNGAL